MQSKNLSRKILTKVLGDRLNLKAKNSELAMDILLSTMVGALAKNRRIEIRNFGCFEVHEKSKRIARNPRTGEFVFVSERHHVFFKAGQPLKQKSNTIKSTCVTTSSRGDACNAKNKTLYYTGF